MTDTARVAAAKKDAQAAAAAVARATRLGDAEGEAAARATLTYAKTHRAVLVALDGPAPLTLAARRELIKVLEVG